MSLIVVHRDKGVETRLTQHEIGAERSLDIETSFLEPPDRGNGDPVVIVAEQPTFPGVRIDAAQSDARTLDA